MVTVKSCYGYHAVLLSWLHPCLSVCWSSGKAGHFASNCPTYRASAFDGEDQLWNDDQVIGLTLVNLTIGLIGPTGLPTL